MLARLVVGSVVLTTLSVGCATNVRTTELAKYWRQAPREQVVLIATNSHVNGNAASLLDLDTISADRELRFGRAICRRQVRARDEGIRFDLNPGQLRRISRDRFLEQAMPSAGPPIMLVYVHGFWTRQQAAQKTATILATDVAMPATSVVFMWPAGSRVLDYIGVENNAELAALHLRQLLESFGERYRRLANPPRVVLIAHSMGCRVLTEALDGLRPSGSDQPPWINHVFLVAGDVDRGVVALQSEALGRVSEHISIYSAEDDLALSLSQMLRADYRPRLGQMEGDWPTFEAGEKIDVTQVDRGYLGHDYFRASEAFLLDVRRAIHGEPSAQSRGLPKPNRHYVLMPVDEAGQ